MVVTRERDNLSPPLWRFLRDISPPQYRYLNVKKGANDFSSGLGLGLPYVRVIYSGLSTRLLNHYYTRCTELEIENSWEGNDPEKRWVFRRFQKTVRVRVQNTVSGFSFPPLWGGFTRRLFDSNFTQKLLIGTSWKLYRRRGRTYWIMDVIPRGYGDPDPEIFEGFFNIERLIFYHISAHISGKTDLMIVRISPQLWTTTD